MTSRCARENLTTARLLTQHVAPRGFVFRSMAGVALAGVAMRLGAALVGASTSASALTLATGERVVSDNSADRFLALIAATLHGSSS